MFNVGDSVQACGGRIGIVVDVVDNTAIPYRVFFADGSVCWFREYNLSAVAS